MTKPSVIFLWVLASSVLACSSTAPSSQEAQLPTPEPASAIANSPMPETETPQGENPINPTNTGSEQLPAPPLGLRVFYIREGNLWTWTEAGGSMQLTDTGDMFTARLSPDGQSLAFVRGSEVWTVGVDSTGARLLATQKDEGAALWFAPDGSLLAVSTGDRIDVVDLGAGGFRTVTTFPALPDGYYPEIVWSPDALGFKTVIPPPVESGQAELLFVFTDGTVASLAKFALVPLSESQPFLSPDGGYVIYVAQTNDGNQSMYLMDSSGATKTYGETAVSVRALGWMPDSKRFLFTLEDFTQPFIGEVGKEPVKASLEKYQTIRWIDEKNFLAVQAENLYLGDVDGPRNLIAMGVSDFTFGK